VEIRDGGDYNAREDRSRSAESAWADRRRSIADIERAGLSDVGLRLPERYECGPGVWHLCVVRSKERDLLQK
jgi:hypothetical protein